MIDFELTEADIPALFGLCWHCRKPIPSERQSTYQYYCSDKCEKEGLAEYKKILKKAIKLLI